MCKSSVVFHSAFCILLSFIIAVQSEVRNPQSVEAPLPDAMIGGDCVGCHRQFQPHTVSQWEMSRHAEVDVGCDKCHGRNHSLMFREKGRVSPRVCATCHPDEGAAFADSRHARAEKTLVTSALFAATPEAFRAPCFGCHRIGETHRDGSKGGCNSCHSGHTFSAADAREPEACTGCHTGEDYPQDIAYWTSKHGALYRQTRNPEIAPTCSTCHHPEGVHGDSFGITIGGIGVGGVSPGEDAPFPMPTVDRETFSKKRAEMIRVCATCHSNRFAADSLNQADRVKATGTAMLVEAANIIQGLHADGYIGAKEDFTLHLGGAQLPVNEEMPGAEALNTFYTMWRFHYAWTWKGAYHNSHSVANLQSRPGLAHDLEKLKAISARLRRERR